MNELINLAIMASGGGSSPWQESLGIVSLVNPTSRVNVPTGTGIATGLNFGLGTEGITTHDGLDINFFVNDNNVCYLTNTGVNVGTSMGYASAGMLSGFLTDAETGIGIFGNGSNSVGIAISSSTHLLVDTLSSPGETGVSLVPNGEGLLRISVGANDSGGTGYRMLIIPNV